jgi:hypothetical protein
MTWQKITMKGTKGEKKTALSVAVRFKRQGYVE